MIWTPPETPQEFKKQYRELFRETLGEELWKFLEEKEEEGDSSITLKGSIVNAKRWPTLRRKNKREDMGNGL